MLEYRSGCELPLALERGAPATAALPSLERKSERLLRVETTRRRAAAYGKRISSGGFPAMNPSRRRSQTDPSALCKSLHSDPKRKLRLAVGMTALQWLPSVATSLDAHGLGHLEVIRQDCLDNLQLA